jgi:molecular chaperone DnaJ
VQIDTVDGPDSLKVPAGTQPGQVFRVRGKGVPYLDGAGRGDHYVHITVRVPTALSEEQRSLLERLATLEGEAPPERGVFDKVKDFFSA